VKVSQNDSKKDNFKEKTAASEKKINRFRLKIYFLTILKKFVTELNSIYSSKNKFCSKDACAMDATS
jgi:hypothetical protein